MIYRYRPLMATCDQYEGYDMSTNMIFLVDPIRRIDIYFDRFIHISSDIINHFSGMNAMIYGTTYHSIRRTKS